ncbi:MAG: CDP-glycerol glycerophosphotransferase family protein [Lachnospiraceae bacterium]|nr:CDP-glycerol glycerophosphotransferase family protein [Lachnospiraceae bacterium]
MGFFKNRKKRKAARRRARIQKSRKWGKYYRFRDRARGLSIFKRKCMACPIDPNLVVFEAFKGKQYTCNPKAIFEEMVTDPAYAGYRLVWSFSGSVMKKYQFLREYRNVTLVKKGSDKYYEVMATAKYRVTNSTNPKTTPVRKGQIYIQTWHGTPLKRLGCDIVLDGNASQSVKEIHEMYRKEADQFRYLISPSAYTSEKLASAYGLTEEEKKTKLVELGYPRNVFLFKYTKEDVAQIKDSLHIPEGKKVILYAPTFRESSYEYGKGFEYQIALDIERLQKRFGDTACVLLRAHYFAYLQFDAEKYRGFLYDVSDAGDINRLYVISDLLITDYSSVMFDFSILRRPMIFYMYDVEEYRGQLRDFYIEPDILPGPIVTTQDEVEAEIEKALSTPFVCDERYEAFCRKFTYLDDADAAKRVLAAIIPPQEMPAPTPAGVTRYRKWRRIVGKLTGWKKRIKNGLFQRLRYPHYLKEPIDDNMILLENQQGKSMDGNIFALLSELAKGEEYRKYTLYLTCLKGNRAKFKKMLTALGMGQVKVVVRNSLRYYRVLATAKYLINDTSFVFNFIKREEQVYLNTWHGTPLKTLGKRVKGEAHTIGNVQKNLLAADYLLFPNEFTMQHMVEDHMLENIGTGEMWLTGYPRNEVFFRKESGEQVRSRYGLTGKTVYAFMPTWRGVVGGVSGNEQAKQLTEYFTELDAGLPENYVLYVKLHAFNGAELSLEQFSHIRPFPEDCETYAFLNATDGLITDYSSVFFDYALTRKKIILFTYDEEEYESSRGFYFSLSKLPFPQAKKVDELISFMTAQKNYDETEFLKTFCSYDRPDAAKAVCRRFLFGSSEGIETRPLPDNGKRNVVIFGGALYNNGITTSLFNLLSQVDREKMNYILLYKTEDVKKHPEVLENLPEGVNSLGFSNGLSLGFLDFLLYKVWTKRGLVPYRIIERIADKIAKRDSGRLFAGCRVDKLIHFSGYSNDLTETFRGASCNRTIYVHNDMEREVRERRLIRSEVLTRAYQEYDSVAVVTEDIKAVAERIAKKLPPRVEKPATVTVAKNIINYQRVLELAKEDISLDIRTKMNVSMERLQEILAGDSVKFINIGRFSPEKGHDRLLNAFERIHKENPDTYLLIVGGRGTLYDETLKKAQNMECYDHIVIILYLSNPYALLKKCDYFIFSSLYEGFGLVLAEADILGVRCVSTDIPGPRMFMKKYGGTLVEDSEQGVYNGMKLCLDGKVTNTLSVNYEEYNKEALEEFERIVAME